MDDVHEVRVFPVESGLGGDVEPVEGVGHVTGKQGACRVQARDTRQSQTLNTGLLLVNNKIEALQLVKNYSLRLVCE